MPTLSGKIILPPNIPIIKATLVLIELRDTSIIDKPSILITEKKMHNVDLYPNGSIKFNLPIPPDIIKYQTSIRVHISIDGNKEIKSGDLITTESYPISSAIISHTEMEIFVLTI